MAGEIITSCPLCLALNDPADMVDIEIDRVVPQGRAHVLLDRGCGSAVVRAMARAGEPLAKELIDLDRKEAELPPAIADAGKPKSDSGNAPEIPGDLGEKSTIGSKEPDDGKSAA